MRLTILYRPNSEHERSVTDFVEMLRRLYPGKRADLLDLNTREGSTEASIHGITQYPAMILTSYEGRVVNQWEGEPLPRVEEVGSLIQDEQSAPTV